MTPVRGLAAAVFAWALARPAAAAAQDAGPRWYLLDVAVASDSGPLARRAASDMARVRLMAAPAVGPVAFDLAYEVFATLTTAAPGASAFGSLGQPSAGEWLPLQATIAAGRAGTWRHRADRLSARWSGRRAEVTLGRQPISWATTLLLTPADPFAPFDPTDPFREYRAGVDAARIKLYPGRMAELEAVVRVSGRVDRHGVTALGRGHLDFGRLDVALWGGTLYGEAAGSLGATVAAAGAALRGEVALRRDSGRTVVRAAAGADRSFQVAGRTLYVLAELQHDGFGATTAAGLTATALSLPAGRGELQVLGRDEAAAECTYQLHPLVSLGVSALVNLRDGSVLAAPSASYSATAALTLRAGVFVGLGASAGSSPLALRSEYGPVPATLYLSASAVF